MWGKHHLILAANLENVGTHPAIQSQLIAIKQKHAKTRCMLSLRVAVIPDIALQARLGGPTSLIFDVHFPQLSNFLKQIAMLHDHVLSKFN